MGWHPAAIAEVSTKKDPHFENVIKLWITCASMAFKLVWTFMVYFTESRETNFVTLGSNDSNKVVELVTAD